jgi:signal transduction histidine kinase
LRAEQDRRLAALGRLTAGVAHEIKNPLNAVRLSVGRLRKRMAGDAVPILNAIDASVASITQTVADFMKLARDPAVALEPIAPAAVLTEAVAQVLPMAKELGCTLEVDALAEGGDARVDSARLREALVNLLRNALQAARKRVEVTLSRSGSGWRIDVDDDGPGIPPAQRDEIFEFFYTTKDGGTGLGLPLAHRVAEEHGGSLTVSDSPLGGARFTLTFPGTEFA